MRLTARLKDNYPIVDHEEGLISGFLSRPFHHYEISKVLGIHPNGSCAAGIGPGCGMDFPGPGRRFHGIGTRVFINRFHFNPTHL
jgi:hypothetical protein